MNDDETANESVRVTVRVPLSPREAFVLFTDDVDTWWKRAPTDPVGPAPGGRLCFRDGALRQSFADGTERVIAEVRIWDVGARLHLELLDRDDAASTQIEVSFAPSGDETEVVLQHHGCARLAPQHPGRRGLRGRAFADMLALRWADRLGRLQLSARRG